MSLRRFVRRLRSGCRWPSLEQQLIVLRDLPCLMQAMGWTHLPLLGDPHLLEFAYPEDANHRRLRDAEVVGAACRNADGAHLLEIGTSLGHMTAVMARNAPQATIYTVNIPPEDIAKGGHLITHAPSRHEIGSHYRSQGLTNINQIFANTATWMPAIPPVAVAFIDGCHDTRFVLHDTRKILGISRPGACILWHDCNPRLCRRFPWIDAVCDAVDHLVESGEIDGPLWLVEDSWVMLHRLPTKAARGPAA